MRGLVELPHCLSHPAMMQVPTPSSSIFFFQLAEAQMVGYNFRKCIAIRAAIVGGLPADTRWPPPLAGMLWD